MYDTQRNVFLKWKNQQ